MWWCSVRITNQSGGRKTKSMNYDTQAQTRSLKQPWTPESWQPFISVSVHVQHICHLVEVSCTWSVFFSVTRTELWPQALPSWAPWSHNNWMSHTVEPVQLQSEGIHVERRARSLVNPDMRKRESDMEMMCQMISYVYVSFGPPFLSAFAAAVLYATLQSFHLTWSKLWQKCTWLIS